MKRLIAFVISLTVVFGQVSAFAELNPTGPNIQGFDNREEWMETMQSDYRVHEIIDSNVAFVDKSVKAWNKDSKIVMDKEALYLPEKKEFSLPVDAVNGIFGLNEATANGMISSDKVAQLTGKNVFIDPRGLIIFSESANVVNTTVPNNWSHYYDYFTISDIMTFIDWEDREFTQDERLAYIKRWKGLLTIPEDMNKNDFEDFVNQSLKVAREDFKKIIKNSDGTYSVKDIELDGFDLDSSALVTFKTNLHNAYKILVNVAIGYNMLDKNSSEAAAMREGILGCMDYLLGYYSMGWNYNTDAKQNWMLSHVYLSVVCSNLLCLMYDDMTDEERIANTNQIFDKCPIPNVRTAGIQNNAETYTNLLWRSYAFFNAAVIANDTYRMNYALKYTAPAYLYSPRNRGFDELQFHKDGFYEDGSMIFHNHHPYSNGYGLSYTVLVYEMLALTKDTKFDVRDVYGFENVYSVCENNILPFMADEMLMKMTIGRNTVISDTAQLRSCAFIANCAPEPYRKNISRKIINILGERQLTPTTRQYFVNTPALQGLSDEFYEYTAANVNTAEKEAQSSTVFYNQDQVIHKRDDFTAALSMSSTRIHKYEAFPPNNSTGWYLGDGMLYIYSDGKQYDQGYFNNADPYYMPGTTVDSTVRKEINTSTEPGWGLPDNEWAGGVTDGENTVAGYVLGNSRVSGLEGKKSYFMFGDKIICLGSGIKGGQGRVYTVVDNRHIYKESDTIKPIETGYTVKEITCKDENDIEKLPLLMDSNTNSSSPMGDIGDWLTFDFGEKVNIGYVGMAFLSGDARQELATIQVSDDGENFTDVKDFESTGESKDIELYEMNCSGRYFRIVSKGNSRGNAWFNLSEIVFYKETATMEEIEESKNIISSGYETLVIDAEETEPVFNTATPIENPGWVWLENHEGLVFLSDSKVAFERKRKQSAPTYMHITVEHGEKPEAADYAYAILPKATLEETKAFSQSQSIEVIENSLKLQAVRDTETGIIGANIFSKGAELCGITFNTPCSVIIDKTAGKVYISDPTWSQKLIKLSLSDEIESVSGSDVEVNGKEVSLDVGVKRGSTRMVNCKFAGTAAQGGIKVMNYYLKASPHYIKTGLWAGSLVGDVSFEIVKEPSAGRAKIEENTLYYYSNGTMVKDVMVIRARDTSGAYADFNVTVTE